MTTIELKSNLHKLIDTMTNEHLLSQFYDLLLKAKDSADGSLWNRLSIEEQEELINIEKESHNLQNIIPHSEMVKKHKKWL